MASSPGFTITFSDTVLILVPSTYNNYIKLLSSQIILHTRMSLILTFHYYAKRNRTQDIHNNNRSSSKEGGKQHQRTSESIFIIDENRRKKTLPPLPSIGMPSFHQDSLAGGLLELESHIIVASMPGFNSSGSMRILTVSDVSVMGIILFVTYRSIYVSDGEHDFGRMM
ncbi:hypothetical protein GQX74_012413 [Glossina fuscipes]|nr:hypothetical protein GQX74_012413 [Glossina fuscipes]